MKFAYLILAHAHPAQLGRLVTRLQSDDAAFYIHIDGNTDDANYAAMRAAAPHAHFAPRRRCHWGGFSLVDASLRLMRMALTEPCDWLILLSGQDYPLQNPARIEASLAQSPFVAHLDIQTDFDVTYRWQSWYFERFNGHLVGKTLQKLQRIAHRYGLKRRPPITGIKAGSQWWMISARAAQDLLDFLDQHPEVIRFFERTLVPDEMFFQSVLGHLFPATAIGPSLRYIEWEAGSWSPNLIGIERVAEIANKEAFFARKFAPDGYASAEIDRLIDFL